MVPRRRSALGTTTQTFVGLSLLTIGSLAALATVLGFFGGSWWALDALANLRLQLGLALVLVGGLYGWLLGRGVGLLFVTIGLVNAALIVPLYFGSPAEAHGTETLSMVSLNVSASSRTMDGVLEWVEESGADLVFLLESDEAWEAEVASGAPGYTVQSELPGDRRSGITVLARDGVTTETMRLGSAHDPVIRARSTLGGEPLVIYALRSRSATSRDGTEMRNTLLEDLADRVEAETDPVVVIGDLSATPWSAAFRALQEDGDLINSLDGYGLQPSWPANLPFGLSIPIDHMLHSDGLTTTQRGLGPARGPDRKPLMVTVARAAS
ncbi:MAG: endonuclease/exonuclease/phosphatase family protein [Acidimicrobiia bacterium]